MLQFLYVDDIAFPVESHDKLERLLQVIHNHLFRFGLEVHVGKSVNGDIKASNT